MIKRFDNKKLLYILAGLVLVLILTTVFKTNRQNLISAVNFLILILLQYIRLSLSPEKLQENLLNL